MPPIILVQQRRHPRRIDSRTRPPIGSASNSASGAAYLATSVRCGPPITTVTPRPRNRNRPRNRDRPRNRNRPGN